MQENFYLLFRFNFTVYVKIRNTWIRLKPASLIYFKVSNKDIYLNVGEIRLQLEIFLNSHMEHSENLGMIAILIQTFWHMCWLG